MYQEQPNLDVFQMKADLEAHAATYAPAQYGDYQADLTASRTAYGDYPGMIAAGGMYAGASASGAIRGVGNMLTDIGGRLRPATYTPPARVYSGYYGQYQQESTFFNSAITAAGFRTPPRGVSGYMHGYNAASDLGERVGSLAVSAAALGGGLVGGAAGSVVGTGLGSILGAAASPLLMGAGATIGGLAGGMIGYAAVDEVADMVAQRRQMNAFLESSSFRYTGAGNAMADPRLGSGMDPRSRRATTDFLHKMDVRDPSMNMDDMFNILQGATSLGLFTGARDVEDFKSKFKEIVDGVKTVSKALHTSLQEGLQVMKDLKAIDVTPGQMGRITYQAEVAGKIAGRTPYEIVNLGLQGAELYRGTGIEMKIGYQANVMNIAAIRSARDAGMISQEAVNQAGGEESMAQQMTSRGLQFMQSSWGRGLGGAYFKSGAGPGGFNRTAFMNQMLGGGMDMAQTYWQSAMNLGKSVGSVIEYEAYQDKFMSEQGKAFGGDTSIAMYNAIMQQAKYMADADSSIDIKAAFRLVAQRDAGMSPGEADLAFSRISNARSEFDAKRKAMRATTIQRTVDEAMSTSGVSYGLAAIADTAKTYLEPAISAGEDIWEGVKQKTINKWEEKVVGVYRYDVGETPYLGTSKMGPLVNKPTNVNLDVGASTFTKDTVGTLAGVPVVTIGAGLTAAGIWATKAGMAQMAAAPLTAGGSLATGAVTTLVGGAATATGLYLTGQAFNVAGRTRDSLGGDKNVGAQLEESVRSLESSYPELSGTFTEKPSADPGDIVVRRTDKGVITTTPEKLNKARAVIDNKPMTMDEAKGVEGAAPLNTDVAIKGMARKRGEGPLTLESLAQSWFKTSYSNLEKLDRASFLQTASKLSSLGFDEPAKLLEEEQRSRVRGQRSLESATAMQVVALDKNNAEIAASISDEYTKDFGRLSGLQGVSQRTLEYLSLERQATTPEEKKKWRDKARDNYLADAKRDKNVIGANQLHRVETTFDKIISSKGEQLTQVFGNLQSIDIAMQESGGRNIMMGFSMDLKTMDDKYRDKAKGWLGQLLTPETGYQALLPKNLEEMEKKTPGIKDAIGSTAWGSTLLSKSPQIAALDELKTTVSEAKDVNSKEFQDKYKGMVEKLNVEGEIKQSLFKKDGSSKEDITRSITDALDRIVTSIKSGEGNKQGVSAPAKGFPDASAVNQGTGQEQDAVQMNINVSVLKALEALNTHLVTMKGK